MGLAKKLFLVLVLAALMGVCSADKLSPGPEAYALVDMMNAFLIMISCVFIFGILGLLRNQKLLNIIRSVHFLKIKSVISAWTLLGSAILLFTLTELMFAFGILTDPVAYKLLKTIFGVLFAGGLFMQYNLLVRYVKQATAEKGKLK